MKKKKQHSKQPKKHKSAKPQVTHKKKVTKSEPESTKQTATKPKKKKQIHRAVILISILFVTLLAYIPAFQNDWVNWDDDWYILENPHITSLKTKAIQESFSGFYKGQYSPLTMLSLAINYHFSEYNPKSYHITSVFIHVINTALVFWFIFLLVNYLRRKQDKKEISTIFTGKYSAMIIAAITSLLFGVHTLQVESVAWVSAQKVALYSLFFLASLISYVYYVKHKRKFYFIVSLILFIFSFLSKEQAMVLSVTLVAIDFIMKRNLLDRKVIYEKIPFFALSILFGVVSLFSQEKYGAISGKEWFSFIDRVAYAGYSFLAYLYKLIIPLKLSAFYPYPVNVGEALPAVYWLFPLLSAGIIAAVIYSLKYTKILFFGFLFYAINIFLTLQIVFTGRDVIIADRYIYIPGIGIFFLIATGFYWLWQKHQALRYVAITVLLAVVVSLAVYTYRRSQVWSDGITLWEDVQSKYPMVHVAFYNCGNARAELGNYQAAIEDYNTAQPLKPQHIGTYSNRGIAYANIGKLEKALKDFNKVIELDSTYMNAYSNRGNVRTMLGDFKGAIRDYNKAIKIDSTYVDAFYNRGIAKDSIGDYQGAIKDFTRAISKKSDFENAYFNRAVSKFKAGDTLGAQKDFNRVKQMNPKIEEKHRNLAKKAENSGDYSSAVSQYEKLIMLNPNSSEAYLNRGINLESIGKLREALQDFNKAAQLNPNNAKIYVNRGVAKGKLGDLQAAINDLNKAVALEPELANAYANRGLAYMRLGNIQAALHDYNKAIELNPEFITAYSNRAIALKQINNISAAMTDYDTIIKLRPKFANAYYQRALLHLRSNNRNKACADLKKAAELGLKAANSELNKYCQ